MSTEVGGWSKKCKIMSTWLLNDPQRHYKLLHSAQFSTWMWQLIVKNSQILRTQHLSLIPWPKLCILSPWIRIWAYFLLEMPHFAKKCNFTFYKNLKSKFTFFSFFNFTIFFASSQSVIELKKRKNLSNCEGEIFQFLFWKFSIFLKIPNWKIDF